MKTFEEVYETLPGNGWLTKAEAAMLWEWSGKATGPILEVGSHQGRSTVLLAARGLPVYAVDPFLESFGGEDVYYRLVRNLMDRDIRNVTVYWQSIENWAIQPCSFAYLDGDHTYLGTLRQIVAARSTGVRWIAVHDVNDSGDGAEIQRACLEQLGPWANRVERLAVWELS